MNISLKNDRLKVLTLINAADVNAFRQCFNKWVTNVNVFYLDTSNHLTD